MAQSPEPSVLGKRGSVSGRPVKSAASTPMAKKRRLSSVSALHSPAINTPSLEKRSSRLPWKLADNHPLPTVSKPQDVHLSTSEYQSIAASAILAASLFRSQMKWTCEGLFERHWVKPETGKNARPPPPGNPDVKWMKHKGECRIRIEPHIYEAQMFVEERPPPPTPQKQYVAPKPYVQPQQQYRPGQPYAQGQQAYQGGQLPPIGHTHPTGNILPPISSVAPSAPPPPARTQPSPAAQDKKTNPDPVISKLAARASSDPELKRLMKEVATGNATPEQLKVFQRHIDELQVQIQKDKDAQDAREKTEAAEQRRRQDADAAAQREEAIQYDGAAGDSRTSTPTPASALQQQQYQRPVQQPVQYQQYTPPQAQPYVTPAPAKPAVVLAFSIPGATEDRFRFPENSILEALSENHLLASFIVTRKGRDAVDSTGLDPSTEYWQPVTLMIEVKFRLEELLQHVRRWVKPADEVKRHMEGVMKRCVRAPEGFLAMQLPIKGSKEAESEDVSKEGTPMSVVQEAARPKSSIKYVKKATTAGKGTPTGTPSVPAKKQEAKSGVSDKKSAPSSSNAKTSIGGQVDGASVQGSSTAEPETTESGRPKRTTRKSVRISEG